MKRIKLNKLDYNRILLTELLPYEVPMLYSNEGWYSIVSSGKHEHFQKKLSTVGKGVYGVPFNYEIAKSNNTDTRTLSIIHPIDQLGFIELYKKYDSIILHLCAKSPFSLRRPIDVASFTFSAELALHAADLHKNAEVEVQPDILDNSHIPYKSYFVYDPLDLIYKFFDKSEFQRLEQRFEMMVEFDVGKCFYHIYTHSITWAVKQKEIAKKNAKKSSFENFFDKLMQQANYNETNGIVVGPEISRIFAEIILQEVDIQVLAKLNKEGYKIGIDYEVRRYVDDFFVFVNQSEVSDKILNLYKKELSIYKLFINSDKTKSTCSPFITDISVGKREIKSLTDKLFDDIFETYNAHDQLNQSIKLKQGTNYSAIGKGFIKDFQCIVKQNGLKYGNLNKDVVRIIKRQFVKAIVSPYFMEDADGILKFCLLIIEIIFYCYSLNINASVTFKIAQFIVVITKYCEKKKIDFKHSIYSRIVRDAEFVMTNYHRKTNVSDTNIETINLVIALKKLGEEYLLPEKRIREYFNLADVEKETQLQAAIKFSRLNYFQIIALLWYFSDIPKYKIIKSQLEKGVEKKFELASEPFQKAEYTSLFFDYICCPFVSIESKKKVCRHSKYQIDGDLDKTINEISDFKLWFMNWEQDIDLEVILKKKEWTPSY